MRKKIKSCSTVLLLIACSALSTGWLFDRETKIEKIPAVFQGEWREVGQMTDDYRRKVVIKPTSVFAHGRTYAPKIGMWMTGDVSKYIKGKKGCEIEIYTSKGYCLELDFNSDGLLSVAYVEQGDRPRSINYGLYSKHSD